MVSEGPTVSKLQLPAAPLSETGSVKAWEEPVLIQTYMPATPDPNPLFLEKRVYQGSSGRVYPLPVIDRVDTEPQIHQWKAARIENEFIRLMILPEIGGRIHVGLDKRNGYDFFYRQNVIKPALVGLAAAAAHVALQRSTTIQCNGVAEVVVRINRERRQQMQRERGCGVAPGGEVVVEPRR